MEMTETLPKKRIAYIDVAKGIGILLMILGHTMTPGWGKDVIYSFHMPLFFVCSGMTCHLSASVDQWRQRVVQSAQRLLLPVVLWYVVLSVISGVADGCFVSGKAFREFLSIRLLTLFWASGDDVMLWNLSVPSVGVLWFVVALFLARLMFDALHLFLPRAYGAVSLLLMLVGVLVGTRWHLPLALDLALVAVGFLAVWSGLGRRWQVRQHQPRLRWGTVGAAVIWVLGFVMQQSSGSTFDMAKRSYPLVPLSLVTAVAGCVVVLGLCAGWEQKRWLSGLRGKVECVGHHSMLWLGIHYLGYLPYLYYRSLFESTAVLCIVRLVMELLVASLLLLLCDRDYPKRGSVRWWQQLGFVSPLLLQLNYLLFCRFPGGLQYDSLTQLQQVVTGNYTNHHPIFHTIWMTVAYRLAQWFGGDLTLGVFFFTSLQIVVFSYMVSYVLRTLREIGIRPCWLTVVLGIYLFYPFHLFFASYVNKDSLFTYCGVIFVVAMFRLGMLPEGRRVDILHLVLGGMGVCLFRTNGWLAMVVLLLVLLLFCRQQKRLVLWVAVIVCGTLCMRMSLRLFPEIAPSEFSEQFSIPIQQVSRVIADECELTEEEEALCNALCDVSQMTGDTFVAYVRDNYNAWRADEIKGQIQFWGRDDYFEEHKKEYLQLWLSLGRRYPGEYLAAWVDMTSGYWSVRGGSDYIHEAYDNDLGVENVIALPTLNRAVNAYLLTMQKNSVLRFLVLPCVMLWATVAVMVLLVKRSRGSVKDTCQNDSEDMCQHHGESSYKSGDKRKVLSVLCVLPLAVVLTLLVAVPLNGEPRYVYLLYGCLPFVASLLSVEKFHEDSQEMLRREDSRM